MSHTHLDARWPPWHESDELARLNPVEGLVHLERINLALDDVEQGQVATLFRIGRDHKVLRVEQPSHDIQNAGLSNAN